jgi:autotransporter passenger strand-loop-strand repeat protein
MSIINISSGNTTSGSVISSGTVLAILTGGVGYDTSLQGGVETVYAGGTAVDDIISSGSFDVISSGGTDTGATVANGGYLIALPGSIVDDTEVLPGGIVTTSTGVVLVTTWYNRGIFEGASTSGLDLDSSNELFVRWRSF